MLFKCKEEKPFRKNTIHALTFTYANFEDLRPRSSVFIDVRHIKPVRHKIQVIRFGFSKRKFLTKIAEVGVKLQAAGLGRFYKGKK